MIPGNVDNPFGAHLHVGECSREAGDDTAHGELNGLAVRRIEGLAANEFTFVGDLSDLVARGCGTGTGREFLVVDTTGKGFHTGLLGHLLDEVFVLLLHGAVEFLVGFGRHGSYTRLEELTHRLRIVGHATLVEDCAHTVFTIEQTGQEHIAREVLGGVLSIDLLFDLGEETRLDVHTGLHTHLVRHFLFVVAGIDTVLHTLEESIHVG